MLITVTYVHDYVHLQYKGLLSAFEIFLIIIPPKIYRGDNYFILVSKFITQYVKTFETNIIWDTGVQYSSYRISYSETTWAVGIAQLTHHEVQGGGKNPETGGRGIFAPTADRVVS